MSSIPCAQLGARRDLRDRGEQDRVAALVDLGAACGGRRLRAPSLRGQSSCALRSSSPALVASRNVSAVSKASVPRPVVPLGTSAVFKPELRALLEPPLGLRGRPEPSGQADLAERGEPFVHRLALRRGGDRERDRRGRRRARRCARRRRRSRRRPPGRARARRGARARRRSSRAASGRRRFRRGAASQGRSARRAPAPRAGSAACPRARRRRRCPARPATVRPKSSDGSGTPTSPAPVISNTPSSFVEPNRFFVARRTRCAWYRSPSNWSTQSTRCSSTRGPATAPSFVTWPTRIVATPDSFATRSSRAAASRTCATEPGAEPSSDE